MRRFPGRSLIACALALIAASFATGLAHEHVAEHDGGAAHVERAHGGHAHALQETEPQVRQEPVTPPPAALGPPLASVDIGDSVVCEVALPPGTREPHGPDPPDPLGPRAPPPHAA